MNRAHFVQIFIEFYLKIRKIKSVNYGCSIYVKIRAKQKIYGLQLFTIMINNKDFRNLRKGLQFLIFVNSDDYVFHVIF